jgi:hypothetical protein
MCDDNNTVPGDGCNASCVLECASDTDCNGNDTCNLTTNLCESFICGNGVREGREECDGSDDCHPTECKILGICGDGTVNNHSALTRSVVKDRDLVST